MNGCSRCHGGHGTGTSEVSCLLPSDMASGFWNMTFLKVDGVLSP